MVFLILIALPPAENSTGITVLNIFVALLGRYICFRVQIDSHYRKSATNIDKFWILLLFRAIYDSEIQAFFIFRRNFGRTSLRLSRGQKSGSMGSLANVHKILRFLNHGVETNQSQVPMRAEIDALGSMECPVYGMMH